MNLATIISYLPIAMYAESLHLHNALGSVIASTFTIPPPLTGCIRDFSKIWRPKHAQIISGPDQYIVASLRHGNTFPLQNKNLLDLAQITSREANVEDAIEHWRPVAIHLSFLTPTRRSEGHAKLRMMYTIILSIATAGLLVGSSVSFAYGLWISGILLLCLLLNLVLMAFLQWCTGPIFNRKSDIAKDTTIGAAGGAALDVHVVVENFNASELHVLVGFSAHLHSLTNIPIRIRSWRSVVWITRLLGVVLVIQATALASQFGGTGKQVVGSGIWQVAYLVLLTVSRLMASKCPDALLRHQPTSADRLGHITFSNRRAALAFIATLPVSPKAAKWDWMNEFVPAGDRRKPWEVDMAKGRLGEDLEIGQDVELSARSRGILEEVGRARSLPEFVDACANYCGAIGLTRPQSAPDPAVPKVAVADSPEDKCSRIGRRQSTSTVLQGLESRPFSSFSGVEDEKVSGSRHVARRARSCIHLRTAVITET